MKYGYCRVRTKGQLDGNSIEEQLGTVYVTTLKTPADGELVS